MVLQRLLAVDPSMVPDRCTIRRIRENTPRCLRASIELAYRRSVEGTTTYREARDLGDAIERYVEENYTTHGAFVREEPHLAAMLVELENHNAVDPSMFVRILDNIE